jgi:hypothetical protein
MAGNFDRFEAGLILHLTLQTYDRIKKMADAPDVFEVDGGFYGEDKTYHPNATLENALAIWKSCGGGNPNGIWPDINRLGNSFTTLEPIKDIQLNATIFMLYAYGNQTLTAAERANAGETQLWDAAYRMTKNNIDNNFLRSVGADCWSTNLGSSMNWSNNWVKLNEWAMGYGVGKSLGAIYRDYLGDAINPPQPQGFEVDNTFLTVDGGSFEGGFKGEKTLSDKASIFEKVIVKEDSIFGDLSRDHLLASRFDNGPNTAGYGNIDAPVSAYCETQLNLMVQSMSALGSISAGESIPLADDLKGEELHLIAFSSQRHV